MSRLTNVRLSASDCQSELASRIESTGLGGHPALHQAEVIERSLT